MDVESKSRLLSSYKLAIPKIAGKPIEMFTDFVWNKAEEVNIRLLGAENLQIINSYYARGMSGLYEGNHRSHYDHAAVRLKVLQESKAFINNMIWLVGTKSLPFIYDHVLNPEEKRKFAQEISQFKRRTKPIEGFLLQIMANSRNMKIIPTVQSQIMGEGAFASLNGRLAYAAIDLTVKELSVEKTAVVAFYEGGRKDLLSEGEQGSEFIIKKIKRAGMENRVFHVPLGLVGTDNVLPKSIFPINTRADVSVRIGRPYFGQEIEKDAKDFGIDLKHLPMLRIAALMDPLQRGFYNDPSFAPYLKHLDAISGIVFDAKETSDT